MQYCSSVLGVVVHILLLGGGGGAAGALLLGGRLLGAALLMLGGRLLGGGGGGGADALHCSCSVVGRIIHCLTTGFSLAAGCGHDTSRK